MVIIETKPSGRVHWTMINDHSLVAIKHRTHKFFFRPFCNRIYCINFLYRFFCAIASREWNRYRQERRETKADHTYVLLQLQPIIGWKGKKKAFSLSFRGHRRSSRRVFSLFFDKNQLNLFLLRAGRSITSIFFARLSSRHKNERPKLKHKTFLLPLAALACLL